MDGDVTPNASSSSSSPCPSPCLPGLQTSTQPAYSPAGCIAHRRLAQAATALEEARRLLAEVGTQLGHVDERRRANRGLRAQLLQPSPAPCPTEDDARAKWPLLVCHPVPHLQGASCTRDLQEFLEVSAAQPPQHRPARPWRAEEAQQLREAAQMHALHRLQQLHLREAGDVQADVANLERLLRMTLEEFVGEVAAFQPEDWRSVAVLLGGQRTAEECCRHWHNSASPAVNPAEWSPREDQRLLQLVSMLGEHSWGAVSNRLGSGRTAFQCLRHWMRHHNHFLNSTWTEEEERTLAAAVQRFGECRWALVADALESPAGEQTRTAMQCFQRWRVSPLNPAVANKSPWTRDEGCLLYLCRVAYEEGVWTKISQHFNGRGDAALREHWTNVCDPDIARRPWTKEEDTALLKAVEAQGAGQWASVAAMLKGRPDNACRRRWMQLRPSREVAQHLQRIRTLRHCPPAYQHKLRWQGAESLNVAKARLSGNATWVRERGLPDLLRRWRSEVRQGARQFTLPGELCRGYFSTHLRPLTRVSEEALQCLDLRVRSARSLLVLDKGSGMAGSAACRSPRVLPASNTEVTVSCLAEVLEVTHKLGQLLPMAGRGGTGAPLNPPPGCGGLCPPVVACEDSRGSPSSPALQHCTASQRGLYKLLYLLHFHGAAQPIAQAPWRRPGRGDDPFLASAHHFQTDPLEPTPAEVRAMKWGLRKSLAKSKSAKDLLSVLGLLGQPPAPRDPIPEHSPSLSSGQARPAPGTSPAPHAPGPPAAERSPPSRPPPSDASPLPPLAMLHTVPQCQRSPGRPPSPATPHTPPSPAPPEEPPSPSPPPPPPLSCPSPSPIRLPWPGVRPTLPHRRLEGAATQPPSASPPHSPPLHNPSSPRENVAGGFHSIPSGCSSMAPSDGGRIPSPFSTPPASLPPVPPPGPVAVVPFMSASVPAVHAAPLTQCWMWNPVYNEVVMGAVPVMERVRDAAAMGRRPWARPPPPAPDAVVAPELVGPKAPEAAAVVFRHRRRRKWSAKDEIEEEKEQSQAPADDFHRQDSDPVGSEDQPRPSSPCAKSCPSTSRDWHFWYSHCQIYNRLPEVHYDMEEMTSFMDVFNALFGDTVAALCADVCHRRPGLTNDVLLPLSRGQWTPMRGPRLERFRALLEAYVRDLRQRLETRRDHACAALAQEMVQRLQHILEVYHLRLRRCDGRLWQDSEALLIEQQEEWTKIANEFDHKQRLVHNQHTAHLTDLDRAAEHVMRELAASQACSPEMKVSPAKVSEAFWGEGRTLGRKRCRSDADGDPLLGTVEGAAAVGPFSGARLPGSGHGHPGPRDFGRRGPPRTSATWPFPAPATTPMPAPPIYPGRQIHN